MEFELRKNEKLSEYTTLHIGGEADYLAIVKNEDELKAALRFAKAKTATPPLLLGGGSNVLCGDEGYRGLVIVNKISGYEVTKEKNDSVTINVGAGEVFDGIIQKTVADGYWGLENLSAIPGSVGATPIQNVGAYGVEISSLVTNVTALNLETLEEKVFSHDECQFAYRDSYFKSTAGKSWCVTRVTYSLSTQPSPNLEYKDLQPLVEKSNLTQREIREHVVAVRAEKFPDWNMVGTAGSFFKNPIISQSDYENIKLKYPDLPAYQVDEISLKIPLGWVLDKICSLRGYRKGNVRLFENQALVLVAESGATSTEVEEFVNFVSKEVKQKTNITIEREVLSI